MQYLILLALNAFVGRIIHDILKNALSTRDDLKLKHLEIVMQKGNATFFAGASNMSVDQIQQLFSPVVPGNYVNNLVFPPSTNPQDSIYRAIEALRQLNPANGGNPVAVPPIELPLVHG